MNLRKFVAANSRDCLKMMRAALGEDAMVVSTRNTPEGIEIVGASADDIHSAPANVPSHLTSVSQARAPLPMWETIDEDESVQFSPAARVLSSTQPNPVSNIKSSQPAQIVSEPIQFKPSWPKVKPQELKHVVRSNLASGSERVDSNKAITPPPVVSHSVDNVSDTERSLLNAMEAFAEENEDTFDQVSTVSPRLKTIQTTDALRPEQVINPLMQEMRAMKSWLESQMHALKWRDATQREPVQRECWLSMVNAGISPVLARSIVAKVPDGLDTHKMTQWLCQYLEKKIHVVASNRSLVEKGGVYALIGPTGVGKTTTTAKLAARCVVKYGARSLGLITTDQYRIGAIDQLRTFGRILGVDVYTARTAQDLDTLLKSMASKKLVLIDTTGISQKDKKMSEHLDVFASNQVERLLVVAAGTHVEQADDVVRAYQHVGLSGMILSKLDESVRIGGVIDAAIRHHLPLHYMTTGQRVPEDLHAINVSLLVHRLLRQSPGGMGDMTDQETEWASMPVTPGLEQ